MTDLNIPWVPRIIMTGRTFRLPIRAANRALELQAEGFQILDFKLPRLPSASHRLLPATS